MEDTKLAEAAPSSETAGAAAPGVDSSQLDLDSLSLSQVEDILSSRAPVDVPLKSGGEGTTGKVAAAPKAAEPPPGEQPGAAEAAAEAAAQAAAAAAAEIEAAAEAAAAAVVAEGGDEEAQAAAAEEVRNAAAAEAESAAEAAAAAEAETAAAAAEAEIAGIERPRLKDERDQMVMGVYLRAKREADAGTGEALTFAQAEAKVDAILGVPAKKEAAPQIDYAGIVTTLEGEVAELSATLDGFEEGLWTPEIRKATEALNDKKLELRDAKRDLQTAADRATQERAALLVKSDANRTASHAEAVKAYPTAADKNTPLGKAIAAEVIALKDKTHPDHAILYADSAPLVIAQRVAARLGIAPVAGKATTPPVSKVVAPPRKVVSPAPGNKTAVASVPPAMDGKAQVQAVMDSDDLSLLDAVQGLPDPTQLLVGASRR